MGPTSQYQSNEHYEQPPHVPRAFVTTLEECIFGIEMKARYAEVELEKW
jgi:hypothetical protein